MRAGEWTRQLLSVDNWDYLLMVSGDAKFSLFTMNNNEVYKTNNTTTLRITREKELPLWDSHPRHHGVLADLL